MPTCFSDLDDVLLSGNSPNNSLSVSSGDERDPRARSPSQERSRRKDKYTIHEFNFIKVLGKGSFGKVRVFICLSNVLIFFKRINLHNILDNIASKNVLKRSLIFSRITFSKSSNIKQNLHCNSFEGFYC